MGRFLNDVWRSDDLGKTWSLVTSAPFAPRAAAATVAANGRIFVAGGRGEDGCFRDVVAAFFGGFFVGQTWL